jgi:Mg2+-importing ATPase
MSVVVSNSEETHLLVCKGAVEEVLTCCAWVDDPHEIAGGVVPLTASKRVHILSLVDTLHQEGLRVLAVAYKRMPALRTAYGNGDEAELVLAGYIAFLDPPKETAASAIAALQHHQVAVKIITGDTPSITRTVCREVGLAVEGVLLGAEVELLDDAALTAQAEHTTIFAKMSPLQKSRVIQALQRNGHTVGYLGDGINDAAALRDADIGISVDTAVDIAKESADIILLEKNLMVLEEGILEGRRTFANILKYIKITASSNFGNVFSVLIASIFLPFLPMLPLHLLIQNLMYDLSQIAIPWDSVDAEYLRAPRKWEAAGLARFMVCVGPISSLFDITTFGLMWYLFGANAPAHQALFQSGWFVEGLLSQMLVVYVVRTAKIPFLQSMPGLPVLVTTSIMIAVGIAIPYTVWGQHVGFTPLPYAYFGWLGMILLGYILLTQGMKRWYIRRFGQWL